MFTFEGAQAARTPALQVLWEFVVTFGIPNRSDSHLTVLVLIEALIVADGGLFFVRQNPAVI
ncbi:hypothetical protein ABW42_02340 [Stenotrophomonas maltophilia]|nr:hypothetical protein ABW42_02340 [Stenotrophomonas maltophilia]